MENLNPEIFISTLRTIFDGRNEQVLFVDALGIKGDDAKTNAIDFIDGLVIGVQNYLSGFNIRNDEQDYPYYLAFTKLGEYLSSTPKTLADLKQYNDEFFTQLPTIFLDETTDRLTHFYPDTTDLVNVTSTDLIEDLLIGQSGMFRIKNNFYPEDERSVRDITKIIYSGDYSQETPVNGYIELIRFAKLKELYHGISNTQETKNRFRNKLLQNLHDNPKLAPTIYRKISALKTSHLQTEPLDSSVDNGLPIRLPAESHEWYMRHRMNEVFSNIHSEEILRRSAEIFQDKIRLYVTKLPVISRFIEENPDIKLLEISPLGSFDNDALISRINHAYIHNALGSEYSDLIKKISSTNYRNEDYFGQIKIVENTIRKLGLFDKVYSNLKERGIEVKGLDSYVSKKLVRKYEKTQYDSSLSELFIVLHKQSRRMCLNDSNQFETIEIEGLLTESTMYGSIKKFGLSPRAEQGFNEAEKEMLLSIGLDEIPQDFSETIRKAILVQTSKFFGEQKIQEEMIEDKTFLSSLIVQHCAEVFINKASSINRTSTGFEIEVNGEKIDFPISKSSPGKHMSQSPEYSAYIDFVSNVTFHDTENNAIRKILSMLTDADRNSIMNEMGDPATTTELNFGFVAYNTNLAPRTINYFGYRKLFSEFESVYQKNPDSADTILNDLKNLKKYFGKSKFEVDKISLPFLYRLLTLYNNELLDLPEITQDESIGQLFRRSSNIDLNVVEKSELRKKIEQEIENSGLMKLQLPSLLSDETSGIIDLEDSKNKLDTFINTNNVSNALNNYMYYLEKYNTIRKNKGLPYGSYEISGSDFIKIHSMNILRDSSLATNIVIDIDGNIGSMEEYMRRLLPVNSILQLEKMKLCWSDKSKSKFIVIQEDEDGNEKVSEHLNLSNENLSNSVIQYLEREYSVQLLASAGMAIVEPHLGATGEGHHKCSGDQTAKNGVEDLYLMTRDVIDDFIDTYKTVFGKTLFMTLDTFLQNYTLPLIRL